MSRHGDEHAVHQVSYDLAVHAVSIFIRRPIIQIIAEKWLSEFGRIVFTRYLNGLASYLDPAEPISRKHIERAAKKANVPAHKIDETVRSLSEHLGWDITKGVTG